MQVFDVILSDKRKWMIVLVRDVFHNGLQHLCYCVMYISNRALFLYSNVILWKRERVTILTLLQTSPIEINTTSNFTWVSELFWCCNSVRIWSQWYRLVIICFSWPNYCLLLGVREIKLHMRKIHCMFCSSLSQ